MRIWLMSDFRELDRRRITAQHQEAHMLWEHIVTHHKRWLRWHEPQFRTALWNAHERAVQAFESLGYVHQTPIPEPLYETPQESYPCTPESLNMDRWTLICRWAGDYKGVKKPMPSEYQSLIYRYVALQGCPHNGPVQRLKDPPGTLLCGLCKRALRYPTTSEWTLITAPVKGAIDVLVPY